MLDENIEDIDTSLSSSDDENNDSSDAEGGDTDDEEVSVKKGDWEKVQTELKSIKQALKEEREKKKDTDLSSKNKKVVEKEEEKDLSIPKWRVKEIETERISHEASEKKKILKRFPSLAADNDFGIDEDVVENYNDLLQGCIRRGKLPRTKEDVLTLLEKAVKITHPDLLVEEAKNKDGEENNYTGLERGESKREGAPSPKLSEQDKKFKEHINNIVGKEK